MIKHKCIKIIISILSLNLVIPSTVSSTALNSVRKKDKDGIKNTLKGYFDVRYESYSNLKLNKTIDNYFALKDSRVKQNLDYEKKSINLELEGRRLQQADLSFCSYKYYLNYENMNIYRDMAKVSLKESHDIYFNCSSKVKSQMVGLKHEISMKKEGTKWLIIEDRYESDVKEAMARYIAEHKSLNEAADLVLKVEKEKANEIKKVRKVNVNRGISLRRNETYTLGLNEYDRLNAAAYASEWALNVNPKWWNYEYEILGGDCTNFTSQCIYAGGIPFDSCGNGEELCKWYWYSDSNRVSTWTGAKQFNEYIRLNKDGPGLRGHFGNWDDIIIGDIVQLGGEYPNTYHSMFVTGYVYSDTKAVTASDRYIMDYQICQHSTSNRGRLKNYPMSSKISGVRACYIIIDGWSNCFSI